MRMHEEKVQVGVNLVSKINGNICKIMQKQTVTDYARSPSVKITMYLISGPMKWVPASYILDYYYFLEIEKEK